MTGDRYVLLGLAPARAPWFRAVASWATAASIPAEFVKCVSIEEVQARLASGRSWSALVVDGRLPVVDRDLVDRCREAGTAVLVVDDGRGRDWRALAVHRVLPDGFDRAAFLDALAACAPVVTRPDALPADPLDAATSTRARATTVAVCGPGGTGVSTIAVALAQGLADERAPHEVLLADLALHAEQAMLHDAGDVLPGVQELVESFRTGRGDVASTVFSVEERGYDLLLGLRRARSWPALRPRAFHAAFEALLEAYDVVVCDTDADLEGEAESGSADVEDRHVMARTAARFADVVVVVGAPGMKGLHSLVRVVADLHAAGVPTDRVVPVVNRAPRSRRARAETAAAFAALTPSTAPASPLFLAERPVDSALRDGVRLPAAFTAPLVGACRAVQRRTVVPVGPVRVQPGTVPSWWSEEDEAVG